MYLSCIINIGANYCIIVLLWVYNKIFNVTSYKGNVLRDF